MNPNSFFLMYRKIFAHEIWKNPVDFRLFFLIVGNAVFSAEGVDMNGVHVKRGQWLRSYRNLQKDLEYKEKRGYKQYGIATIKRSIDRLIRNGLVTVRETDSGTLFEVVNYEKYQGFQGLSEHLTGTDKETISERYRNKNNNVKQGKEGKNNTLHSKLKFEMHHMKLAELLFKKMRENNPRVKQPNLESWANTFRLMMERDNRTGKEIQDLILWSQQHHFWYKNILSAEKLRKQFDRLWMEMKDQESKQFQVINGGKWKQDEVNQSSYQNDYSKYDFTKKEDL